MTIHIFNPEHDMALAANKEGYIPSHAARQLKSDLSFIPALWAEHGDMVLVDDVDAALESVRHLKQYAKDVVFITPDDLAKIDFSEASVKVAPWGWDKNLRAWLLRKNAKMATVLPSADQLMMIRDYSSRAFAATHVLPAFRNLGEQFTGECAIHSGTLDDRFFNSLKGGKWVLKSPWSSSGRGVKYVNDETLEDDSFRKWAQNVSRNQGYIMVEPYYNKVRDFGMEFYANEDGSIDYCGLSLFDTSRGAYTGNLLAAEEIKVKELAKYVDVKVLNVIRNTIIAALKNVFKSVYVGPFGVDMMVVAESGADHFLIHPCVEMNLRRTMGHVALAISPSLLEPRKLMQIGFQGKFKFKVVPLMDDLLNTSLV